MSINDLPEFARKPGNLGCWNDYYTTKLHGKVVSYKLPDPVIKGLEVTRHMKVTGLFYWKSREGVKTYMFGLDTIKGEMRSPSMDNIVGQVTIIAD